MSADNFIELIHDQGDRLFRPMPWRDDTRPYYVLVSELMLQQTQVERVVPKFQAFIERFSDEHELARAPLADVLRLWQGLGYNRRAQFLHVAAQRVHARGVFPDSYDELVGLPGVGPNTAGAILAYAFNQPAVFIETNVRTVYLQHFFDGIDRVTDKEIRDKLTETLDVEHPREFYWALMDYGSFLKRQGAGQNHRSHGYKKQPPLEGSMRQMRGMIVRELTVRSELDVHALPSLLRNDPRFAQALTSLVKDGLVTQAGDSIHLTK